MSECPHGVELKSHQCMRCVWDEIQAKKEIEDHWREECNRLRLQVMALRHALALARSMILSGEDMTPWSQDMIDRALRIESVRGQ